MSPKPQATSRKPPEGWHGWDDYAAFYDWENARTLGRRDLTFWRRVARREAAPALELGCGTGRLLVPLAQDGARIAGVDRSMPMLARASARLRRNRRRPHATLVRGDIRTLPFPDQTFGLVIAAYGILQSLLRDVDLNRTLGEAARVLRPGGVLGIDLVPDLVNWSEYERRVSLSGRSANGRHVSLIETVRQDRAKRLTIFDEEFVVRRGRDVRRQRFSLSFRTLSVRVMKSRLERAGFAIEGCFGDYRERPLAPGAEAWVLLARRR